MALSKEAAEDAAFYKVIREMLECPVCMDTMHPPIIMCSNGHNWCFQCSRRLSKCPMCRSTDIGRINVDLGEIYDRARICCKYRDDGCPYKDLGVYIFCHMITCEYKPRRCVINPHVCPWTGLAAGLVNHFRECAYRSPRGTLFHYNVDTRKYGQYEDVFLVESVLIKFVFVCHKEDSVLNAFWYIMLMDHTRPKHAEVMHFVLRLGNLAMRFPVTCLPYQENVDVKFRQFEFDRVISVDRRETLLHLSIYYPSPLL